MTREELLTEIRARLETAYGDRLRGVVLYGSEARGQGDEDSDIDILVLLDGPVATWQDIRGASDAVYPLMLEIGRTIDVMPVNVHDYEKGSAPLYATAAREGIRL